MRWPGRADAGGKTGAFYLVQTRDDRCWFVDRQGERFFWQLVAYHWFEHADGPNEGRFDGENSNDGIVNIRDEPYDELGPTITAVNAQVEAAHAGGTPRP